MARHVSPNRQQMVPLFSTRASLIKATVHGGRAGQRRLITELKKTPMFPLLSRGRYGSIILNDWERPSVTNFLCPFSFFGTMCIEKLLPQLKLHPIQATIKERINDEIYKKIHGFVEVMVKRPQRETSFPMVLFVIDDALNRVYLGQDFAELFEEHDEPFHPVPPPP